MCFFQQPKEPPPPPPPPQAPPVLEQNAPQLSETGEDNTYLDRRSRGFKQYKIDRRNAMMSDTSKLGGVFQAQKGNY